MKLPQMPKRKEDKDDYENVAAQVLDIVNHELGAAVSPAVKDRLMQSLIIYVEGLTHVVHKHAYRLGQDSKEPELEPEEEG